MTGDAVENMAPFERLHPDVRHHIVNSLGWTGLREVQSMSIGPILDGDNCVILAPTAGGKTEAAFFPVMSQMIDEDWQGLSVLYLSPIRALLNNQFERLEKLFGLIGRSVGMWHGDVAASVKKRIRAEPPDVLLTTPESIEGMLISARTNASGLFGNLRLVVIDEIHAFAGDDRGWHLLGVLHRLCGYADRDVQRLGLSATVGNSAEIVRWLSAGSNRGAQTIDPPRPTKNEPEVTLDWVKNLSNAAQIISKLHRGERRLVFCDSRIQCEKLTRELRKRGVTTHVVHSSLSTDERRVAERAFSEGGPGVIVATSALELGIDIGSLDRVLQIDAPTSVASFLQRMGRTGRRPGTTANMLFLAVTDAGLARAAALIAMWKHGYVEPARAPQAPLHILAQQMLATALERPGIVWPDFLARLERFCETIDASLLDEELLFEHLCERGFLYSDGVHVGMGREGEGEYGKRNFLELVSVFTTPPIFKVLWQNREIGEIDQSNLFGLNEGDKKVILLAGRSWLITNFSWRRRVAYVEPFDQPGDVEWKGGGPLMSRPLAEAHRELFLGDDTGAEHWSERARVAIAELRNTQSFLKPDVTTIVRSKKDILIWTFAGDYANAVLAARLRATGPEKITSDGFCLRINESILLTEVEWRLKACLAEEGDPMVPDDHPMLRGLKFHELLPGPLLQRAARARLYGDGATQVQRFAPAYYVHST